MKFATHVFIGEAVHNLGPDSTRAQKRDEEGYGLTVKFRIKHILKGVIKNDYVIIDQRDNGSCGIGYKFGKECLIFATDKPRTPPPDDLIDLNDFEYLNIDSMFEDSFEKAHLRVQSYFDSLKNDHQFMYADLCTSFSEDSKYYERAKKYTVGNQKSNAGRGFLKYFWQTVIFLLYKIKLFPATAF